MPRVLLATATYVLMTANLAAQPYDFRPVDAVIEEFLRELPDSGVGLIVTRPHDVIYDKTFGTAVPGEIVELYSSSKMPTTTAILTLVGEGRLGLDDRVGDYLSNWPADKQAITLRHCLSCMAGFQMVPLRAGRKTLEEQVAEIAELPLVFPPGEQFSYSGMGFQVAGRVAEVVTGQTWNQIFRERIADPLRLPTFDFGSPRGISLAGGAACAMQDYAEILRLHLNNGRHGGRQILADGLAREMRRDQVGNRPMRPPLPGIQYGLSWWITLPNIPQEPSLFSDQGLKGSTPWIDTHRRYGAFFYLTGSAGSLRTASRLMDDLNHAINDVIDAVEEPIRPQ